MNSFTTSLHAYRIRSAEQYSIFRESSSIICDSPPPQPYKRQLFPSLQEYLHLAASRYQTHLSTAPHSSSIQTSKHIILGEGPFPQLQLSAHLRARWLRTKNHHPIYKHPITKPVPFIRSPPRCGIPSDIRASAARLYSLWRLHRYKKLQICVQLGSRDADNDHDEQIIQVPVAEHVMRCKASLQAGEKALGLCNNHMHDNEQEVRARYLGKPDELYRRKMGRKYARWRRICKEEERKQKLTIGHAEKEMKRRRGMDMVMSGREKGDVSFAPFLFETEAHAFAFSSRITEAPKLRKVMVDKYSQVRQGKVEEQMEKALLVAERNPLFHTRVMNRFG